MLNHYLLYNNPFYNNQNILSKHYFYLKLYLNNFYRYFFFYKLKNQPLFKEHFSLQILPVPSMLSIAKTPFRFFYKKKIISDFKMKKNYQINYYYIMLN